MTERPEPRPSADALPSMAKAAPTRDGDTPPALAEAWSRPDQAERALGRMVAVGLPLASIAGAIAVGVIASVGSALLVLAAGALLGAVGLLWASVRTLSGDAPLTTDFEMLAADQPAVDALGEDKGRLLRALKDLESEHAIGKIDDADYQLLSGRYRDEAKEVMRQMDEEVAPFRQEAERLTREYLAQRGFAPPDARRAPEAKAPRPARIVCGSCGTSNEPDAAFCKQCGASIKKEQGGARA
jgi:hypothetical protein